MRIRAAADSQVLTKSMEAQPDEYAEFEWVFRDHYDRVYSLAYRLCGDQTTAEDLAQDTFVRAARAWTGFRGEAHPWSWLFRITVNAAADAYRKSRRSDQTIRKYANATHFSAKQQDSSNDNMSKRVQRALSTLPIRRRAAIVLTACEGLSHREAANILGCSETTVSWHVHRAKKELKRVLTRSRDHE